MTSVAATTVVGLPSAPTNWSPSSTSPMVVQPVGVGSGVSRANAFPTARLAVGIEVKDRPEHRAVGRPVEVILVQELEDLGDRIARQQHRAENRFLSFDVVRGNALVGRGSVGPRASVRDGAHGHRVEPPYASLATRARPPRSCSPRPPGATGR